MLAHERKKLCPRRAIPMADVMRDTVADLMLHQISSSSFVVTSHSAPNKLTCSGAKRHKRHKQIESELAVAR